MVRDNSEAVIQQKSGRMPDACKRYGLGRTKMKEVAMAAGAEIKIDGTYLINYSKVDAYMDEKAQ